MNESGRAEGKMTIYMVNFGRRGAVALNTKILSYFNNQGEEIMTLNIGELLQNSFTTGTINYQVLY